MYSEAELTVTVCPFFKEKKKKKIQAITSHLQSASQTASWRSSQGLVKVYINIRVEIGFIQDQHTNFSVIDFLRHGFCKSQHIWKFFSCNSWTHFCLVDFSVLAKIFSDFPKPFYKKVIGYLRCLDMILKDVWYICAILKIFFSLNTLDLMHYFLHFLSVGDIYLISVHVPKSLYNPYLM